MRNGKCEIDSIKFQFSSVKCIGGQVLKMCKIRTESVKRQFIVFKWNANKNHTNPTDPKLYTTHNCIDCIVVVVRNCCWLPTQFTFERDDIFFVLKLWILFLVFNYFFYSTEIFFIPKKKRSFPTRRSKWFRMGLFFWLKVNANNQSIAWFT